MTKHTFYIGEGRVNTVKEILVKHDITGATVFFTEGIWEGEGEPSMVVEILSDRAMNWAALSRALGKAHGQKIVLYTRESVDLHVVAVEGCGEDRPDAETYIDEKPGA